MNAIPPRKIGGRLHNAPCGIQRPSAADSNGLQIPLILLLFMQKSFQLLRQMLQNIRRGSMCGKLHLCQQLHFPVRALPSQCHGTFGAANVNSGIHMYFPIYQPKNSFSAIRQSV